MPLKSTAIVGAGIAGLTLAISLAKKGISSDIFEQADALKEVGAGLQIPPNAARVLDHLGILPELRKVWTEPRSVDLRSGITLKTLASVPMGDAGERRWKAPYGVLHRATLQQVLLDAVTANPLCRLHLGSRLELADPRQVHSLCAEKPDLVVGADGVWSKTRLLVEDAPQVRFTGNVAWRVILPFDQSPDCLPRDRVAAFMAPGAHLISYPLKDGGGFNLVAITSGMDPGETWNANGEPKRVTALRSHFSGWNPALRAVFDRHQDLIYWPLCETGTGRWHNGRDVVLIGDAAHAMMPFMAQGAAMAIEDAKSLSDNLFALPVPQALLAYETIRQPRIARLKRRATFNRMVYHARGPLKLGRDLIMSLRPSEGYMADLDWLFGHTA